jgi:upstream activation factor subunit UAF30
VLRWLLLLLLADRGTVTDEETRTYTRIIDGILATVDLQTVTRKKIRQGLEAAIDKDLSDQKVRVVSGASAFLPSHIN